MSYLSSIAIAVPNGRHQDLCVHNKLSVAEMPISCEAGSDAARSKIFLDDRYEVSVFLL